MPAPARRTRARPERSTRRAAWCCCATGAGWSTFATARRAAGTVRTTRRSGAASRIRGVGGGKPAPSMRVASDTPAGGMSRITDDNIGGFLDGGGDAWCNKTKLGKSKFRWTETVPAAELSDRVAAEYPEVGRVKQLAAKQ